MPQPVVKISGDRPDARFYASAAPSCAVGNTYHRSGPRSIRTISVEIGNLHARLCLSPVSILYRTRTCSANFVDLRASITLRGHQKRNGEESNLQDLDQYNVLGWSAGFESAPVSNRCAIPRTYTSCPSSWQGRAGAPSRLS